MVSQFLRFMLLVRLSILVVVAVRATGENHGVSEAEDPLTSDACNSILDSWVHQARPQFINENKTLQILVGSLYDELDSRKCFPQNQLWLELWWISDHPGRPENFGSSSYFEKYERCRQLEPEHFVFHSTTKLDAGYNSTVKNKSESSDKVVFTHVVEREYVLRVCPCGRTRHNSAGLKVCDCKYTSSGKPHCSGLFRLEQGPDAMVYPWCRADMAAEAASVSAQMAVHSPIVNCTSVLLTGVLPACTPLQPYDRVQLALHLFSENATDTSIIKCSNHHHFGDNSPVIVEESIHNINGSHGDFSVHLGQLRPNAVYCLQLELVNHPYCNSHLTIGHGSGLQPKVCSSYTRHPVITPPCLVSHGQLVLQSSESRQNYVVMVVATCLACIVGFVCVAFFCLFKCVKKQSVTTGKGAQTRETRGHRPQRSRQTFSSIDNGGHSIFAPNEDYADNIFLLRMPHSSCTDDVHVMFSQWLSALGCRVHDMTNPDEDEAINADPEGWVHDILSEPNVKVVIIEGDNPPSVTAGAAPSAAAVATILETKEKLLVVPVTSAVVGPPSSIGTGSTPLTVSATSSVDERWSKKSHDGDIHNTDDDDEADPLLDDPRGILRVYAWKYIQSHFVGKYNQVLLVRFVTAGSPAAAEAGGGSVSSLTPLRRSLLVPHHLPEIRQWLRPGGSKTICRATETLGSSSVTTATLGSGGGNYNPEVVVTSEKRLLAALGVLQYDCI